jgi:hypothetical protein
VAFFIGDSFLPLNPESVLEVWAFWLLFREADGRSSLEIRVLPCLFFLNGEFTCNPPGDIFTRPTSGSSSPRSVDSGVLYDQSRTVHEVVCGLFEAHVGFVVGYLSGRREGWQHKATGIWLCSRISVDSQAGPNHSAIV